MFRELQVCIRIFHIDRMLHELRVSLSCVGLHGIMGLSLYNLVDSIWIRHECLPITEESVSSVWLTTVLTKFCTSSDIFIVAMVCDCPNSSLALALSETTGSHLGLSRLQISIKLFFELSILLSRLFSQPWVSRWRSSSYFLFLFDPC